MKSNLLRNTYAAAVALFIALFSVSLATRAEDYDLEVAGIRVTSQNCNNIAGDPQNFSENTLGRIRPRAGGYVKYEPHSKTLYIKDTNIVGIGETGFSYAIRSAIEGLTILVEGTNSISSQTEGDLGVVLNKKCTLTGGGTLDVTIWDNADFILAAPVTIQNCTIIANNTQNAFYGYGSSLTVRGAKMVVKGEMSGFDLILRGSKLITPSGVSWNAEKKAMCNAAGQLVYDAVITIERDVKNYGLTIAETTVTSTNCDLISDFSGVSGTVSYDPATKTLYLKNAEISTNSEEADAIYSEIEDLNIQVEGNCTVKAAFSGQDDDCEGIAALGSLKILGNGTLNINSETYGIYIYDDKKLTIDNCTVKVKGTSYGIRGGDNTSLLIINSDVTAEGPLSSVSNINNFSTIDCGIRVPQGAKYDKDNNAVCDASGNIVTSPVHIKPSVKYGLYIADVPVTEDNCNDLSVINGVKGTVSYEPATKTLYLKNAEISTYSEEADAIYSRIEDLNIQVEGNCTVKAAFSGQDDDCEGIAALGSLKILGNGTLNINSETYGIYIYDDKKLTIDNCTVKVEGTSYGIRGGNNTTLLIINSDVTAEGPLSSVSHINNFSTIGCGIRVPQGAKYDKDKNAVCDASGNIVTSPVHIKPSVKYGLTIADVPVTEDNCNDLSVIPGVKGTAKYDPSAKTLTLNNAEIISNEADVSAVSSKIEGLIIKLEGINTLKATDGDVAGLSVDNSCTITGTGTLNAEGITTGIFLDKDLTIDGCTLNLKGNYYGFLGTSSQKEEKLTVKNATLTIENSEDGAISRLAVFTLDGCKIVEPAGAVFNAEKRALCDASGNIIKSKVVIAPTVKYGLYINDVEVDELNCNDLSVIPGVKGTVKYAPSTKTLTLNNAEIISGEDTDDAISTSVENLRILLEGTNTLRASDDGIETTKSMTVFGSGTLNIESDYGIYLSGSLTVENGTINIKATNYGIYGDEEYLDNNKLTVKNATLTIENSEDGAICQLSALTLDGCKIAEPAGAVFNAEKHALCDADGNIIKSKVVIRNTLTAIDGIGIGNQHHRSGIYTLDGRRLDTPFRHLPKGIYVVDGRKVVKH